MRLMERVVPPRGGPTPDPFNRDLEAFAHAFAGHHHPLDNLSDDLFALCHRRRGACHKAGTLCASYRMAARSAAERARCSGQGKTDTQGSYLCQRLVSIGTDVSQLRVQPGGVGEHLHVIDHVISRFLPGRLVP